MADPPNDAAAVVQNEPSSQLGYSLKDSVFGSRDRMILMSLTLLGVGCLAGYVFFDAKDLLTPLGGIVGALTMGFNGGSRTGTSTNGKNG